MTITKQSPATTNGRTRAAPGLVRVRLRVLHLVTGSLLAAYPYLPDTTPGHSALRWTLMILVIPIITVSGLWLWKQAAVRRWLRVRADRRG